jgi:ABC-type Zn uptake system ZnuABC Zn-binding protein ZnuA
LKKEKKMIRLPLIVLTVFALLLAACAPNAPQPDSDTLNVVATTTLVADIAARVGGTNVTVTSLIPAGIDPHTFEPTPQDLALLNNAGLILINGAGLEENLESYLEGLTASVISVSEGIELLEGYHHDEDEEEHADEEYAEEGAHEEGDPHVWMSPALVRVWVQNIAAAYAQADPTYADEYANRAAELDAELQTLDAWVVEQVAQIPVENRVLVSDHNMLAYFADQYGFEVGGAIIESFSTNAEPSAQELAQISDLISEQNVRAIFIDYASQPAIAQQLSADLNIKLVRLYNGSLSDANGPAADYFAFIRYNVNAIVEALK